MQISKKTVAVQQLITADLLCGHIANFNYSIKSIIDAL